GWGRDGACSFCFILPPNASRLAPYSPTQSAGCGSLLHYGCLGTPLNKVLTRSCERDTRGREAPPLKFCIVL
ncbi:unnamed protein product, partial [Ectocarpus sp. 12 AP-2014]